MDSYKFIFFGTPRFSVRVLDALESADLLPALIVTAPDKPAGRGQELKPSPVKVWATERGIDVLTPEKIKNNEEFLAEIGNTDWDFFVVAAYGKILPQNVLDIPERGVLNVHPSLLPKFRGPSPVLSAILANERETGVSIMLLDEEMDHGPVLAAASIAIDEEDWPMKGSELEDLLATEGGNLLAETIPQWMDDDISAEEQNHNEATYTRKFTDEDARLDLSGDPEQNLLKIRAFDKNPRAYFLVEDPSTTLGTRRVIVTEAQIVEGKLVVSKVIPEGKKEMPFEEYLKLGTSR